MSLSIVQYNDPVLRRKGEKIALFDSALAHLAGQMIETMHSAEGIGLAAPQVGRSLQLCVIDLLATEAEYVWELDGAKPPRELFMPLVLVNPKVTVAPKTPQVVMEEGCLSFPKIRGDVSRPDEIAAEFCDERGHRHTLRCNGLLSRCVQHEVDHLNGVLFIDRMDKKARSLIDADVKALAKKTRQARKPVP
jgi:peptide deformylase